MALFTDMAQTEMESALYWGEVPADSDISLAVAQDVWTAGNVVHGYGTLTNVRSDLDKLEATMVASEYPDLPMSVGTFVGGILVSAENPIFINTALTIAGVVLGAEPGGTLTISADVHLSGGGISASSGGALVVNGGDLTVDLAAEIKGTLALVGTGTTTVVGGSTFSGSVEVGSGALLTLSGVAAFSGTIKISKGGRIKAGPVVLAGTVVLALPDGADFVVGEKIVFMSLTSKSGSFTGASLLRSLTRTARLRTAADAVTVSCDETSCFLVGALSAEAQAEEAKKLTGIIAGSVTGGVAIIIALLVTLICCRRKANARTAAAVGYSGHSGGHSESVRSPSVRSLSVRSSGSKRTRTSRTSAPPTVSTFTASRVSHGAEDDGSVTSDLHDEERQHRMEDMRADAESRTGVDTGVGTGVDTGADTGADTGLDITQSTLPTVMHDADTDFETRDGLDDLAIDDSSAYRTASVGRTNINRAASAPAVRTVPRIVIVPRLRL